MFNRPFWAAVLGLSVSASLAAQASKDAKYKILGTVLAQQAEARVPMPFGKDGFELSDAGVVDKKLDQLIKKNGQAVEPGRMVTISDISFSDDKIEIELDGGGKNKRDWYNNIEVGMGGATTPIDKKDETKAKGSKIVLKFAKKVPAEIKPELLRELLGPVLDFTTHSSVQSAIDNLPPEYQEAVKAREVRIGMDRDTVIMALGRPDNRFTDDDDHGVHQESWLYRGRGTKALFIWFQNDVVIKFEQF